MWPSSAMSNERAGNPPIVLSIGKLGGLLSVMFDGRIDEPLSVVSNGKVDGKSSRTKNFYIGTKRCMINQVMATYPRYGLGRCFLKII